MPDRSIKEFLKMKINQENESVLFNQLKDFYKSEILKRGKTPYSISLELGEDNRFIWNILNRAKSIETIRDVYYRCYPERAKSGDKKKTA